MISRADIEALKAYVSAPVSNQNQAESTVRMAVTHSNLKANFMEIRLDKHMSIDTVKKKLSSHTGSSPSAMVLQLKDDKGKLMATLTDPYKPLGFYSPYDGCIMHVIDTDPMSASANGWLEDVSKVEKYMMSEEEYAKRDNTYKKYKEDKMRQDPEWTLEKEMCMRRGIPYVAPAGKESYADDYMQQEAGAMQVGSRCEVDPGDRRGEVKFVGQVEGLPGGWWVGVQYDEPVGKNDGSVKGKRYFECPQGYGGFARPDKVKVGDYPPVDDFDFSDDEI